MKMYSKYKSIVFFYLIVAVAGQGCASYHPVRLDSTEEAMVEINRKSEGRTILVGLREEEYFGRNLEFRADSTIFLKRASNEYEAYSNTDISYIALIDHRSGGMKGLKIGFVTGFIATAFAIYIAETAFDDGTDADWPLIVSGGLVGGGFVGVVWGFPIGSLIGKRDIYTIGHDD